MREGAASGGSQAVVLLQCAIRSCWLTPEGAFCCKPVGEQRCEVIQQPHPPPPPHPQTRRDSRQHPPAPRSRAMRPAPSCSSRRRCRRALAQRCGCLLGRLTARLLASLRLMLILASLGCGGSGFLLGMTGRMLTQLRRRFTLASGGGAVCVLWLLLGIPLQPRAPTAAPPPLTHPKALPETHKTHTNRRAAPAAWTCGCPTASRPAPRRRRSRP